MDKTSSAIANAENKRYGGERDSLLRWRCVLWVIIVTLHVGYAIAYAFEARYYVDTLTSPLYVTLLLATFGRTNKLKDEISIAVLVTSVAISVWHLVAAAQMIRLSVVNKQLVFRERSKSASLISTGRRQSMWQRITSPWRCLSSCWLKYGSVDGVYYETVTNIRESFEIITQTYVAYRLSWYVASPAVNHLASLILVVNCWSTPLLRMWYANKKRGPLVRTVIGAELASIYTVAVPFAVFTLYYRLALAHVATRYNPRFFIDRGNLFQQIFTLTWKEWFSTRLAAVLAIASLETIKRKAGERQRRTSRSLRLRTTGVAPESAMSGFSFSYVASSHFFIAVTSHVSHRFANVVFLAIGLAVLVLHGIAASHSPPSIITEGVECTLLLHPWLYSSSLCAVVSLNCNRLRIMGLQHEWDQIFSTVHQLLPDLMAIQFSHCPSLQVPHQLRHMHGLIQLVLFNATINSWDSSAALTTGNHPHLTSVVLLRVRNVRSLPPGLLAKGFPAIVFESADTDIEGLPDTLVELWPPQMEQINLERARLIDVPPVLTKMQTGRLSLSGNRIREIPPSLLNDHNYYRSLQLTDNPIDTLPKSISNFRAQYLSLAMTNISSIPEWVEQASQSPKSMRPFLLGLSSPFCTENASPDKSWVGCGPPNEESFLYYIPIDEISAANPP